MSALESLFNAEPIHVYTRVEALEDGVLVAATEEMARDVGIRIPVAYTQAVFLDAIEWTEEDTRRKPRFAQDQEGREWDVLWMAAAAMRASCGNSSVTFLLQRVPRPDNGQRRNITLRAEIGPDDSGQPVITVMQPDES